MTVWTPPKQLYAGNTMLYTYLNTYLRDNLLFLKSRPFDTAATGNINTTSTSFVEATNSNLSITTYGGNLLYWVTGASWNAGVGAFNTFDLAVDGIRQGHATFGACIITTATANFRDNLNLLLLSTTQIDAGTHNASLYWKTSVSGTANANLYVNIIEIR
jgi:hypothetical protein